MKNYYPPSDWIFGIFHLYIKEDCIPAFKDAVSAVLPQSAQEPGVLRYEYLQDRDDPGHFTFFDVYSDADAYQAHLSSPHLARFGAAIADLLARPHEGGFFIGHEILNKTDDVAILRPLEADALDAGKSACSLGDVHNEGK